MLAIIVTQKSRNILQSFDSSKTVKITAESSKMRELTTATLRSDNSFLKIRVRFHAQTAEKLTITFKTETELKKIVLKDVRIAKLDFLFYPSKLTAKRIEFAH